jgi:hypothetical protein
VQLIIDQLEELVVTVIEEVRARPAVVVAILAGLVAAVVGSRLAAGISRPKPARRRVSERAGTAGDMATILAIIMRNPVMRAYIGAAITNAIRKRLSG